MGESELESIEDPAERVVVEVLGLPESEQAAALEAALARHPELADEVRSRWLALQALGLSTAAPRDFPERLGDFRLIEPLGAGGMGVVYRAEQCSLGREVALKVLRPDRLFFEGAHERFRREVEAIARLQHPGIVPVFAVGEDGGVPYFAMERIAGTTLGEVLDELQARAPESLEGADLARALEQRSGLEASGDLFRTSWVEACVEIARQVAEALQHAHARGILHRDVKPSNIALTHDGRAMLLDFGLASSESVGRLTQSGTQVGTLLYMAPEQLKSTTELGPSVDVYGLAVSLCELLMLQLPFGGESRLEIERRILAGSRDPLRARNRRVPPELELVCDKALDIDPERRYVDAGALAEDLRCVLERRPVKAKPLPPVLGAWRWCQREPTRALAILAAVLLFAVVPGVMYWREADHADELRAALDLEREAREQESQARAAEQVALEEATASLEFLEQLISKGDPARALDASVTVLDALRAGVEQLHTLDDQPRVQARMLLRLGETLNTVGAFDEALPLLERAVALEAELGEWIGESPTYARESLAFSLVTTQRLDEAEELLWSLLEDEDLGRYRGRVLYRLAGIAERRSNEEEAIGLLREARDAYEGRTDEDGVDGWIAITTHLRSLLLVRGDLEESFELAIAAHAKATEVYPPEHPFVADTLEGIAYVQLELGEVDDALDSFARVLDQQTELYGPDSIGVARHAANFGVVLVNLGRRDEGAALIEQAYETYLRELGEDDFSTQRVAEHMRRLGKL